MPQWDVSTGSLGGVLRLIVDIESSNAAARTHQARFRLQLLSINSQTFVGNNIACSISGSGISTISTTFTWASGTSSKTLIDVTRTISANSDGTYSGSYTGSIGATGTQGIGGPTSNGPRSVSFPTLTVPPNTPTGCSASRVSDTSVSVSWSQSHPSNGQATSNTVRRRINGGSWSNVATISPTNSVTLDATANQKLEYAVRANNSAGSSSFSNTSLPVYTSPAAPTGVGAVKDAALDITVSWTPQVAFSEHQHQVEFSADSGSSWTALATVSAGTSSFKHVDPDPAFTHVYRVRARNTATGNLTSAWVQSNTVQLLAPPNAPTLSNLPNFAADSLDLLVSWTHNPVDTTAQTAYELQWSLNGGSTWAGTGKVTSTGSVYTVTADTYNPDDAVLFRVRTWGEATTGGADGAGASPWSTTDSVTFKSRPVVTIVSPANLSEWNEAALTVGLGFSQAEGASFVTATITLLEDATVIETIESSTLAGTLLNSEVEDGRSYTVSVTVVDSNGVTSAAVTADFDVAYTRPVAAFVDATYLNDSGVAQLNITVPDPFMGEVAAEKVTVERSVDGGPFETIVRDYVLQFPVPNSIELARNQFTNPSFEDAEGSVSTPEGDRPVPVGVVADGEPLIWQSTVQAFQGDHSAAFYFAPEPIFPDSDLFPDDDVFPG